MVLNDSETVGSETLWSKALINKQKAQIAQMRDALLSCDTSDVFSVRHTMQSVLVMRIYHQIARIIRYTEEMDKIEEKLYHVIDCTLDDLDVPSVDGSTNMDSLRFLINIQTKLQQNMIDSQKLLDPYLNIKELSYIEVPAQTEENSNIIHGKILDQDSRKKLREGAQAALDAIQTESEPAEADTVES